MIKWARLLAKGGDGKGSCLPSSIRRVQRFNFDELAKEVARGLSRREALRLALTGLAGAALTSLGIKRAWATEGDCPLVQVKAPSTDSVCTASPWQGFRGVDFQCCCVQHDYCFTTCCSSFETCNASFYNCLVNQCQALEGTERFQCEGVAFLMYQGVSTNYPDSPLLPRSGYSRYLEAQSTYCASTCPDGETVCEDGYMCSGRRHSRCVPCDTCVDSVQPCA
jgi:hypothetical protein